jgi:16S rRNA (adenine1518-N6/adenine1519-N6)-dimethyltransferase
MELPNKSLGQHWLEDEQALRKISEAIDIAPSDTILEVGPGLGALTKYLVKRAKTVIAVEFDQELARRLPAIVPDSNLHVISEDILKFDLTRLPPDYKVAANIPYYLTSKLLRVLAESPNQPKSMVLLVQKEVAERVAARPGNMSVLGVSVQFYYEAKLADIVPAAAFYPPPKVDSQIVILHCREKPLFPGLDKQKFFKVVKAGFSEKRKKLRSSLSGGLGISKAEADELLNRADINPDLRAESLSLEQWHKIYTQYIVKTDLRSLLK